MRPTSYRSFCAFTVVLGGAVAALVAVAPATAGSSVAGTVSVAGADLVIRTGAATTATKVGQLRNNTKISIVCQVDGEYVRGRVRYTNRWDRLTNGRYVSDAFIRRDVRSVIPTCPSAPVQEPGTLPPMDVALVPGAWMIPVPKVAIGGFRTVARPEHDGVDLSHPRNTPIQSISAGTVVTVRCNTSGTSCDVDGSNTTKGCGWYAEVRHAGNLVSRYCHMIRQPSVKVGDVVTKGQILGYVGTSGHSSGPHLHFEIHLGYPASRINAIDPVPFMRQAGAPLD